MNNKIVLLFTGFYIPGYKGGGPIKTITNLVDATSDVIDYKVVTSDRDLGDHKPYSSVVVGQWNNVGNCSVFYSENGLLGLLKITKILFKKNYDIVYLNSFF